MRQKNLKFAVFAFLVTAFTVIYYILGPSSGEFHADCTDTILWARASYDGKSFLNPDFSYACFMPLGGNLFMLPFTAVFGLSMKAHKLGMLMFFLCMLIALFLLCYSMRLSRNLSLSLISFLLLITSLSVKLREIFWNHIIYYSLGIFFLIIGLSLFFQYRNCIVLLHKELLSHLPDSSTSEVDDIDVDSKIPLFYNPFFYLVLSTIWVMLCATNGLQALVIFIVPMFGGIILERFFDNQNPLVSAQTKFTVYYLLCATIGVVLGLLIRKWMVGDMVAFYADEFTTFSDSKEWSSNLMQFIPHWISLFGVDVSSDISMASLKGILSLFRIVFACIVGILPVSLTIRYPKVENVYIKRCIWVHWTLTGLIMFGFVFGKLSSYNWRLSPILFTAAFLSVFEIHRQLHNPEQIRTYFCICGLCFLVGAISTYNIFHLERTNSFEPVIESLQEHGLTYGYGTFWQSNVITVLSGGNVKSNAIVFYQDGNIGPYHYQNYSSDFHLPEGTTNSFLLLTEEEYGIMCEANPSLMNAAFDRYWIDDYIVLIYEGGLF